jgi:hypothetical protein
MIREANQHVGKPSLRIDVVELGGGDEGVDRSGTPAAFIGASEGLVSPSYGGGAQFAFGGIVRHAQAPVVEESGECIPAAEAVIDRLGRVVVAGEPGALLAQPLLQLNYQGAATLLAHAQAPLGRKPVDLAFDGERDIDALDRLGCDRRLAEPREIEELAPAISFDALCPR